MKNATDILVDISDNMEGNRKAFAQRVLLDEILTMIDFTQVSGLKTFMASGPVCLVIRSIDLGVNPRYEFEQKINNLPMPNSGAPISNAIRESVAELKKQEADNKRIVIVTNGVDTLAGSYVNAVRDAAAEGVQVSIVLVGANDSAKSQAAEAAAAGNGACCCVNDDNYDTFAVRSELAKLNNALSGQPSASAQNTASQSAEKKEEPASGNILTDIKGAVEDLASAVHEKLQEGGVIDIDDLKSSVTSTINQIGESISDVFEPINTEKKAGLVDQPNGEDAKQAEENIDLAEIIAKNKESLSKLQAQATESINLLMESCGKAIADLQDKASQKITELMNDHNSSASNLMQKSAEAFDKLSKKKDDAEAKVNQLIADDQAVIIRTDSELADKIEQKSQQYLNMHLQKKYPGRVKWMNENGDAMKGYDFIVDDNDTASNTFEYVIACKGILDDSKTFFMREREWNACVKNARNYQVYVISNLQSNPTLTIIDNLMDAIATGKVVPCASANTKLKAGHVVLTIK